jgi:hypothetical protein
VKCKTSRTCPPNPPRSQGMSMTMITWVFDKIRESRHIHRL